MCLSRIRYTEIRERHIRTAPFIYLMMRNFRWTPNIGFGKVRSMLGSIIEGVSFH